MPDNNPRIVRYVGGSIAALAVFAAIVFFGINSGYFPSFSGHPATSQTGATVPTDVFMAQVENREAWYDHRAIATWVAFCLGVHSPENLPESLRWSLEPPGRVFSRWTEEQPTAELTSQHRAVMNLSNALYMERIDSVERLGSVSQSLEKFQVSAIIIGLLTTVFISLSSTDIIKDTNTTLSTIKMTVKIFAIVLPAIGTAVAALNTFYDPKSDQIRYSRMSDSAGLLHRQIALGVANLFCVKADGNQSAEWGKNASQIDAWINAHKTLTAPSTQKAETATSSDNSTAPGGSAGSPKLPTPKN
jgi:hypothetical protein